MNLEYICQVPNYQRPVEEFKNFTKSWSFSLTLNSQEKIYSYMLERWSLSIPFNIFIANGSFQLRSNHTIFIAIVLFTSLLFSMIFLKRQWLGWKYILNRLLSEKVEYGKSGWCDGSSWKKHLI